MHNCYQNYKRVNDVFTGRMVYELAGNLNKRMSNEAMQLVSIYGSFFIQFSKFTYIRVGVFDGELVKLPRYVFDHFVLIEVCRQLAHVDKKFSTKKGSCISFPIELGHYSCQSKSDALNLKVNLKKFNFQFFTARSQFDNKGFVRDNLDFGTGLSHTPKLEDYWEDCSDEFEVRRRLWCRFSLGQIITLNLSRDISGVSDNEEQVIDPQFEQIKQSPIPKID